LNFVLLEKGVRRVEVTDRNPTTGEDVRAVRRRGKEEELKVDWSEAEAALPFGTERPEP